MYHVHIPCTYTICIWYFIYLRLSYYNPYARVSCGCKLPELDSDSGTKLKTVPRNVTVFTTLVSSLFLNLQN